MINDGTFAAIAPLLEVVNARGLALNSHHDSALELLEDSVNVPYNVKSDTPPEKQIDRYRELVNKPIVSKQIMEGHIGSIYEDHEETQKYIRQDMRLRVDTMINRAINLIQPFYIELTKSAVNIPTFERALKTLYDVKLIEHYEGWKNEWCDRLLNQMSGVQRMEFGNIDLKLPGTTPETSVVTNNHTFDEMLVGFTSEFLVTQHDIFSEFNGYRLPAIDSIEAFENFDKLFYILMVISASDDAPWEDSGLSLEEWDTVIGEAKVVLSSWVIQYLTLLNEEPKEGVLIRDISNKKDGGVTVLVNPISNVSFVEAGGSVEVIYGMLLDSQTSGNTYYTINEVAERKASYIQIWDDFVVAKRANDATLWLGQVKAGLITQFRYSLVSAPEGLFDEGIDVDKMVAEFTKDLEYNVNLSNVDNIDQYLFSYLRANIFKGEDTIDLLMDYDYFLKEGLSQSKAQEQAVIRAIFRWVTPQIIFD